MARPIKIPIVSDVSGFIKGTSDVEGALDDVASSLDDLGREAEGAGDDAGRALSDGIEDGARDAERALDDVGKSDGLDRVGENADDAAREVEAATERMERSFKDAFDAAGDGSTAGLGRMTRNVDEAGTKASASMDEVKGEALQNASETFSSFDGSARSLVDGVQGTFGGIVSSLGPLGAAVGAAGALGIGAIVSGLDKAKERAQEFRDQVGELAGKFVETGSAASQELGAISENLRDIAEETEEGKNHLGEWRDQVDELGLSWETFARALGGDMEANKTATAELTELIDGLESAERRVWLAQGEGRGARDEERQTELDNATELRGKLEEQRKAWEEAREIQQAYYDAGTGAHPDHVDMIQDIADDVTDLSDTWSTAFDEMSEDGKVTAEELAQTFKDMLAEQAERAETWTWAQRNLTAEQLGVVQGFGEDAHVVLETLMNTPPELRAGMLRDLQALGERKAQAEVNGVVKGMDRTVSGPTVIPTVDNIQIQQWENELRRRTFNVEVRPVLGRVRQVVP